MTAFERLRESGIPIDWPAVFLGWVGRGRRGQWIGTEEVRDYAFSRLTTDPPPLEPENERAVIDLAFVEDADHWTVQRCLEQLTATSPADTGRSQSVWRWFFLDEVVAGLENRLAVRPADDSPYYRHGEWHDDFVTILHCNIRDFWEDFPFPAGEFSVAADDGNALWENVSGTSGADILEEYRHWLGRERDRLIAGG